MNPSYFYLDTLETALLPWLVIYVILRVYFGMRSALYNVIYSKESYMYQEQGKHVVLISREWVECLLRSCMTQQGNVTKTDFILS